MYLSIDVEKLFEEKLVMYPHLKNIRDKLWASDSRSRVTLMVGAGFSLNAEKIEESFEEMAVWNDLKEKLVQDLKHHLDIEYKDVLDIGQIYVNEYGRARLDEILKEAIPDDNYEPDELHYNLLKLPWADIYTTNYDTLLERAKKHIYERNYQVIYDISDIPSSVQPRIIKLHGSFPANRPFIFTTKDYDQYPERFSPFVNMVQQSIMETTFVLIGFSGDDPNFHKWTTWVLKNLGEHMPKIYMIGYGQKYRKAELEAKGITLIDFEEVYRGSETPFYSMFNDLFDFLAYKQREEKTKWPHRNYKTKDIDNFKYNRETYPGWVVMPDEIRRKYAKVVLVYGREYLSTISNKEIDDNMIRALTEILWGYEKFSIPLDYNVHKQFQKLLEKLKDKEDKEDRKRKDQILFHLVLRLLREARLDCNQLDFEKYQTILENLKLNNEQKHHLTHEKILYYLNFNDIEVVESLMDEWKVGLKEIEWGIKKASLFIRLNETNKAKKMLETYLQTIRSLLAIKPDDYRLLSLESIALHNRNRIMRQWDYGYDRLKYLNTKYCDIVKEFNRTIISIKKYGNNFGTKKKRGFDPGTATITSSFGDYLNQELLDSFAVLQMKEIFDLSLTDEGQYDLALINLEINHPLYSQIIRMNRVKMKKIDELFSREIVYQLDDYKLSVLVRILMNVISNKSKSPMDLNGALEILSRIYFALPLEVQRDVDAKIFQFINEKQNIATVDIEILQRIIKRMAFSKNKGDAKSFFEKLMSISIRSQANKDQSFYKNRFFEPFLIIFHTRERVSHLEISDKQLLYLFTELKNKTDYSIREVALIRLTFLALTNSLPKHYYDRFISDIESEIKDRKYGLSDFIPYSIFDMLIHQNEAPSVALQEDFVKKEIPKFYEGNIISIGRDLSYFNELTQIMLDYIGSQKKRIPEFTTYKEWLGKFYRWWESQKAGLLKKPDQTDDFLPSPDYLFTLIIILKNHIWGSIPKEYLDEGDIKKAKQVFVEIDEKRPDLSLYLVPCFERLNIDINYSLKDILYGLQDSDIEKVKVSANLLYDYLVFIDKKEVQEEITTIKTELFNMIKYGSQEILKVAVDTLFYTIKNVPDVIETRDCEFIIDQVNNYLKRIKDGNVKILVADDFELIASFSKIIAYICKNKSEVTGNKLDEWKEYIRNHRLPEVRIQTDILDTLI